MKKYTLVYLYCEKDAVRSSYDQWYPNLESALEDWDEHIDPEGWHEIGDPLPGGQDDCIN